MLWQCVFSARDPSSSDIGSSLLHLNVLIGCDRRIVDCSLFVNGIRGGDCQPFRMSREQVMMIRHIMLALFVVVSVVFGCCAATAPCGIPSAWSLQYPQVRDLEYVDFAMSTPPNCLFAWYIGDDGGSLFVFDYTVGKQRFSYHFPNRTIDGDDGTLSVVYSNSAETNMFVLSAEASANDPNSACSVVSAVNPLSGSSQWSRRLCKKSSALPVQDQYGSLLVFYALGSNGGDILLHLEMIENGPYSWATYDEKGNVLHSAVINATSVGDLPYIVDNGRDGFFIVTLDHQRPLGANFVYQMSSAGVWKQVSVVTDDELGAMIPVSDTLGNFPFFGVTTPVLSQTQANSDQYYTLDVSSNPPKHKWDRTYSASTDILSPNFNGATDTSYDWYYDERLSPDRLLVLAVANGPDWAGCALGLINMTNGDQIALSLFLYAIDPQEFIFDFNVLLSNKKQPATSDAASSSSYDTLILFGVDGNTTLLDTQTLQVLHLVSFADVDRNIIAVDGSSVLASSQDFNGAAGVWNVSRTTATAPRSMNHILGRHVYRGQQRNDIEQQRMQQRSKAFVVNK